MSKLFCRLVGCLLLLAVCEPVMAQESWRRAMEQARLGQARPTAASHEQSIYALVRPNRAGYEIVDWASLPDLLPYRNGDEILHYDAQTNAVDLAFLVRVEATSPTTWMCLSGDRRPSGYSPCSSRIVKPDRTGNLVSGLLTLGLMNLHGSMRRLNQADLDAVVRQTNFVHLARIRSKDAAVAAASTSDDLERVRRVFAAELTPAEDETLRLRAMEMMLGHQRAAFDAIDSVFKAEAFITRYQSNDLALLVPRVRAMLPDLLQRQRSSEARARAEQSAREDRARDELQRFRNGLSVGTETHCGLAISVTGPVVQVQTMIGPYWLRKNQLYPANARNCRFFNGVYQE